MIRGSSWRNRARCGVAWIREHRFSLALEGGVQRREVIDVHQRLGTNRQDAGRRHSAHPKPERQRGNRLDILRDILTAYAVAACGRADETAVFVHELERQAIELRLQHVRRTLAERLADPAIELANGIRRGHRIETQHRGRMSYLPERGQRRTSHSLCRRVWRDELGVGLFQAAQLVEEAIVLFV